MDLQQYRDKIDTIDSQLIQLLSQRFQIAADIAQYKIENNLEIHQEHREQVLISRIEHLCKDYNLHQEFDTELISLIMNESKKYQEKVSQSLDK